MRTIIIWGMLSNGCKPSLWSISVEIKEDNPNMTEYRLTHLIECSLKIIAIFLAFGKGLNKTNTFPPAVSQ